MQVTVQVDVCDVCYEQDKAAATDPKPVQRFTVQRDDEAAVSKVLCAVHSRSLQVFLGEKEPPGRKPAKTTAKKAASGTRRARRATGVRRTTMSAIEASKG